MAVKRYLVSQRKRLKVISKNYICTMTLKCDKVKYSQNYLVLSVKQNGVNGYNKL